MNGRTALILSLVVALAATAYGLYLYPTLPERVPSHWNIRGEVDGWSSRTVAVFLMPAIIFGMGALLAGLPSLSPKGFLLNESRRPYNLTCFIVVAMMSYLHVVALVAAQNPEMDVGRWVVAGILAALGLIGNQLGKVQRNFWMGIRTPWTLASDAVWIATHRLAARMLFACGVLGAVAVGLGVPMWIGFVALMVSCLWPVVYSLILYKKVEGGSGEVGSS